MEMLFGSVFIIVPLVFIFNTLRKTLTILTGKYVIVIDELADKWYYNDSSSGVHTDRSGWWLYFKDYFRIYNDPIKTLENIY